MYLRNAWYVAAWDRELGTAPLAVRLLGEDVVLYRRADGSVAALEDACPHRKLPLSMGRVKGELIECGYHGMSFDGDGRCVRVPGDGRIPTGARVRAYPVAERYGLLWLWMGDPQRADPLMIYPVPHWDDPAWGLNRGDSMEIRCNYLYLTDNLLDPSHVSWVHPGSFGNAACEATPLQVTVSEDRVAVWRWMHDVEPAPFYAPFLRFAGPCDRKQYYEVRFPGLALAHAVFAPAGTGGEGRELPAETFLMNSYNFFTPVDENTTRYFWFQMRNFAPRDEAVSQAFASAVRAAFEEDRVVLEAVQRGMNHKRSPNINLPIDSGPLRFRRKLAEMIEAESSGVQDFRPF
jgi:phenylpropionate dioxygenase-like ring-hydroxylating dioxygenase large terminal subunit